MLARQNRKPISVATDGSTHFTVRRLLRAGVATVDVEWKPGAAVPARSARDPLATMIEVQVMKVGNSYYGQRGILERYTRDIRTSTSGGGRGVGGADGKTGETGMVTGGSLPGRGDVGNSVLWKHAARPVRPVLSTSPNHVDVMLPGGRNVLIAAALEERPRFPL